MGGLSNVSKRISVFPDCKLRFCSFIYWFVLNCCDRFVDAGIVSLVSCVDDPFDARTI